ncbi:DUF3060 domain-containing protein [Myxococcus sp. RHSTA-1-4]|uniref:DUF3060 domain-containing protein n=1 Tax=Myxococcus sp. RHSTA-1-4 TaxID=2874601 RepID=UPI001CBBB45E|nr:DUF3060 domain-containing protein [Myxococcus sp. RHSTA-1-4]MBZ4418463.1 DUF3060 domain-containing protein [Myxococcus sp. RHSTA-1-4]
MSKKLGAAVFVVMACVLGPMTAGAQGPTSVKVGRDGSVKVRTGDTEVNTQDGNADVRTGDTTVQAQGGDVEPASDEADEGTIEVTGSGETSTHRCTPSTEVQVTGASNTVTLTGECKSITVSGSGNNVKAEAVRAITVEGTANTVTYKRGHGKSKPKVTRTGVNNKVTQVK